MEEQTSSESTSRHREEEQIAFLDTLFIKAQPVEPFPDKELLEPEEIYIQFRYNERLSWANSLWKVMTLIESIEAIPDWEKTFGLVYAYEYCTACSREIEAKRKGLPRPIPGNRLKREILDQFDFFRVYKPEIVPPSEQSREKSSERLVHEQPDTTEKVATGEKANSAKRSFWTTLFSRARSGKLKQN